MWQQNQGGENLEYDPQFLALQQSAIEKPEQQFGDTIIEAQAPEWGHVLKQAEILLAQTADLRVLLLYVWAHVERYGLVAYAQGLTLLHELLQQHWHTVHPRLEEEGEFDPFLRVNALGAFVDAEGILKAVRASVLLSTPHGELSLRDAEHVLEGTKAELFAGGKLRLQELLRQMQSDPHSGISQLLHIEQQLIAIQDCVQQHLGQEWVPDFSAVQSSFKTVTQFALVKQESPNEDVSDVQEQVVFSAPTMTKQPEEKAQVWQDVVIQSREQALEAIEKICSYFEMHEPSHPAPFLLRRVQQTIPMRFPEILQNLMPASAEQFEAWMPKESE